MQQLLTEKIALRLFNHKFLNLNSEILENHV